LQFRQKKDIIEKRKSGSSMAQVGICEMRMVTMGRIEDEEVIARFKEWEQKQQQQGDKPHKKR
jgi:hypothetical protein